MLHLQVKVGSKGHIKVGSNSVMAARTGLIADVPENSFYAGFPARPHQEWLRIKNQMNLVGK